MGILDKIRGEDKPSTEEKKEEKKKKRQEKGEEKKRTQSAGASFDLRLRPHITEKTMRLAEKNQYTFKVNKKANKKEVEKTIQSLYNVDVSSVQIVNIHAKKRRSGRTSGWKKGYKKAVVRVPKGQKIDFVTT